MPAGLRHDAGVATFAAGLRTPFARYWLSGYLADFGDGVRLAAFPLLAAQLTRSPAAVAAVTAVQGLTWLLLGGGLGVVVDRTDRRRLMVAVDVTRAAVIGVLAAAILAHGAGLWLIYLTAFVTGAGAALRDTAAVTCVPRLVQPDRLDQANARLIAGQIVGNELAGPAAGGWLFGLAAVLPFAVNAGTLGIAVPGRDRRHPRSHAGRRPAAGRRGRRARLAAPQDRRGTRMKRMPLATAVIAAALLTGCGGSSAIQVNATN